MHKKIHLSFIIIFSIFVMLLVGILVFPTLNTQVERLVHKLWLFTAQNIINHTEFTRFKRIIYQHKHS